MGEMSNREAAHLRGLLFTLPEWIRWVQACKWNITPPERKP